MNLLRLSTNGIRRILKVSSDPVNHPDEGVKRWAVDCALSRKRLQLERNARALARIHACFFQGSPQNKANRLADMFERVSQHADSHRGVVVHGIQRVLGDDAVLHSESPVKVPNVSAVAAADR